VSSDGADFIVTMNEYDFRTKCRPIKVTRKVSCYGLFIIEDMVTQYLERKNSKIVYCKILNLDL
jgi:hypothetical protein